MNEDFGLPKRMEIELSEKKNKTDGNKKCLTESVKHFKYLENVRRMRLELTRRNRHYPLKVACIPISPPAH